MKILFQGRVDLFDKRGGDTIQIEETARALRNLGVGVDIINRWDLDLSPYDLVHVFQLDWVCETFLYARNVKRQKKLLVLSPIHHSEKEVLEFEDYARTSLRRIINPFILSQEARDILKNVYRSFFDFRKIYPTIFSIAFGYRREQRLTLKMADIVVTQTDKEASDIALDFQTEFTWRKIPLGVGEPFFKPPDTFIPREESTIVTVGRIEPRKNQLRIIDAVESLREKEGKDFKLVIVGSLGRNDLEYSLRFMKKMKNAGWISYVPSIPYEKMPSIYRRAKVCVSASFFETTGLTLLEASMSGCAVISRDGDTGERVKEYLDDSVIFCDPKDTDSISRAIEKAFSSGSLLEKEVFSWEQVAKSTLRVYNDLLKI